MSTIAEVEKLALDLPDSDRALLATRLIQSLPPVLEEEDEGYAEAHRRSVELDEDPSVRISMEQLEENFKNRRRD